MIPNIRITAARLVALLVLAALLCAGVQAAVAAEQTLIMSMGSLKYENATDPTISSEIVQGTGWTYPHYYTHYAPLIEQDTNGKIIPWLAESYEVSDDHKTITFRLRKGIEFADGTSFNASVAKFNFDRILGYGYRDKTRLTLCAPVTYYDSSEVLDEYTLRVQFTQGWLNIARDLTTLAYYYGFISPRDVEPAWSIKGVLKPEKMNNGLGPYFVDENETIPKEKVVLIKRHSWRDDLDFHKPNMDKIVLTLIADPQTAIIALKKGEINFINRYNSPTMDSLLELEKNPDISIKSRTSSNTYFISTAHWKVPFNGSDGILLRKAINYALDREEIAEGAFFGYATPATDTMFLSPLLPDVPECCHKGYEYNIDKAKQILSDAGWKDADGDDILDKNGESLKDFNLVISSASGLNWMPDTAVMVQSQLKKVGIDVKIQTLEPNLFSEAQKNGNFNLKLDYTRPNPMTFQLKLFNSSLIVSGTYNDSRYVNENNTLGNIVHQAGIATREDERNEDVCKACDILYDDAGIIPLVHPMEYAVISSKVKGYEFAPGWGEYEHVEECWIEN
ncbi:MAG: ABC transporter substrate-binding protein [Methanothrix sp.]